MSTFKILTIVDDKPTVSTDNGDFIKILDRGFFASKRKEGWCITDFETGGMVVQDEDLEKAMHFVSDKIRNNEFLPAIDNYKHLMKDSGIEFPLNVDDENYYKRDDISRKIDDVKMEIGWFLDDLKELKEEHKSLGDNEEMKQLNTLISDIESIDIS